MRPWGSLIDRFLVWFDEGSPEECWEWHGYKNKGYASIYGEGQQHQAAHLSIQYYRGKPIPEGYLVRFKCCNRGCVNPFHLELVTKQERMNATRAAGKLAGTPRPFPRVYSPHFVYLGNGERELTDVGAKSIRAQAKTKTAKQIANKMNISLKVVKAIIAHRPYKHLEL